MSELADKLAQALRVIEKQEEALFKIACGQVENLVLSRSDMIDLAEEALPLDMGVLIREACGRRKRRKTRKPTYSGTDAPSTPHQGNETT